MNKRVLMVWETIVETDEKGKSKLTPTEPHTHCDLGLACRILGKSERSVQALAKARKIRRTKNKGGYDLGSVLAYATHRNNLETHHTGLGNLLDPPLPNHAADPLFQ